MTGDQKDRLKQEMACFKKGDFDEAKKLLAQNLAAKPDDSHSILYTGFIALLENRLEDAVTFLRRAHQLLPKSLSVTSLLSDAYYRQDDYANAAQEMNMIKRKAHGAKLGYLAAHPVYEIAPSQKRFELPFVKKDPLPLVQAGINGDVPVNFLVDTGASELIIDTEYAAGLNLKMFGSEKSVFGGGKTGSYTHAVIKSLAIGELHVKNMPVVLLDTRRFSEELYGNEHRVDGIIGTSVFYHFLTTLDYAHGKICFEYNGTKRSRNNESRHFDGFTSVPFWMAGEHFMVAKGKVNGSEEMLFLVDTGLGGMAFTCPESTVKECGFALQKAKASTGKGGGGSVKSIPFDIDTLELGSIVEKNLHGSFGPFPPTIEDAYGFRIGGLISHEFFKNRAVIFDFGSMLLHIK